jgi:MFS family permease
MPAALILAGAARAGGFLACTTQLFHLTPDRGRAFFLCLANILIFVGPSAAPLVAGGVLSAVAADWSTTVAGVELNVFQVMLGLSGVTLLAALVLLRFVKDIRPMPRFP